MGQMWGKEGEVGEREKGRESRGCVEGGRRQKEARKEEGKQIRERRERRERQREGAREGSWLGDG